jgi:hypothetical protein
MTIQFKKAVRENVPLLIGLVGGTGSGKTFTAMRLASGLAGGKPFAVIDTENGRARHYADQFSFDCGDLDAPFKPTNFLEAIKAADAAGYPVIVVDSASHMWSSDGGVLDWQESELDRMAGDDWKKREGCKMAAWIKPKLDQKAFTNGLLRIKAHVILCFRAEQKIEMVRENGKTVIHAKQSLTGLDGWIPICDKNLPFELTTSLLFTADRPGIPQPIKLQEQHRALFPLDRQVNEESGRLIAEWARGGVPPATSPARQTAGEVDYITTDQVTEITDTIQTHPTIRVQLVKRFGSVSKIPADKFQAVCEWVSTKISEVQNANN